MKKVVYYIKTPTVLKYEACIRTCLSILTILMILKIQRRIPEHLFLGREGTRLRKPYFHNLHMKFSPRTNFLLIWTALIFPSF